MELEEIKAHWESWARNFGADLRATTKTRTIKLLEIDALARAIRDLEVGDETRLRLLEVGCGNGCNCLALGRMFQNASVTGIDLVSEMITAAREAQGCAAELANVRFFVGDVLALDDASELDPGFDVVFTVRCLINLNSADLQAVALDRLMNRVRPGGRLLLLENFTDSYGRQNDLRESIGLPRRTPAEFNLFLDPDDVIERVRSAGLRLVRRDDFASLHDVLLYVLGPMLSDGKIDYEDPVVEAATRMTLASSSRFPAAFGSFGQNGLLVFERPA